MIIRSDLDCEAFASALFHIVIDNWLARICSRTTSLFGWLFGCLGQALSVSQTNVMLFPLELSFAACRHWRKHWSTIRPFPSSTSVAMDLVMLKFRLWSYEGWVLEHVTWAELKCSWKWMHSHMFGFWVQNLNNKNAETRHFYWLCSTCKTLAQGSLCRTIFL